MAPIEALPIEIVHTIVAHVDTSDLLAVALVSHLFNVTATPEIYARVRYTEVLARKREKVGQSCFNSRLWNCYLIAVVREAHVSPRAT